MTWKKLNYIVQTGGLDGSAPLFITNPETLEMTTDAQSRAVVKFHTVIGAEKIAEKIRQKGLHVVVQAVHR